MVEAAIASALFAMGARGYLSTRTARSKARAAGFRVFGVTPTKPQGHSGTLAQASGLGSRIHQRPRRRELAEVDVEAPGSRVRAGRLAERRGRCTPAQPIADATPRA